MNDGLQKKGPVHLPQTLIRITAVAAVGCFFAGLAAVGGDAAFSGNDRVGTTGGGQAAGVGSVGIASGTGEAGDAAAVGTEAAVGGTATPTGAGGTATGAAPTSGGTTDAAPAATPASGTGTPDGSTSPAAAGGTIAIGVHDDNPGAAFGQFGVEGGPSGDQGAWIQAIVDWINANGGMGGRQVELVHHVTESLNGSFDQQAERACAFFTEDNDVLAVVGGARVPTLNLVDCLARHETPLVWSYHYMVDQATFANYGDYLYMPPMVSADRLGVWVDAIASTGFLDGGVVGVARYDTPIHERFTNGVLAPALARHGSSITDQVAFSGATSAASAADLSAQANNAIVRFRSRGVNRVLFVPTSAVMPLLFFAAAEAQSYRPQYSLTSYDNPAFQNDNVPTAAQFDGAVGFGWLPAGDVAWEQQPQLWPAAQQCLDITQQATPTGNGSVRRFCDGLFFLKFLLDRGAEPTTAGLRAAVDSLGSSYQSAWTFATSFGPTRHDGAAVGRLLTYDRAGCQCFVFSGGDIPIP